MTVDGDEQRSEAPPRKVTVLLADDDPASRSALKSAFLQDGYGVLEASDGEQALALLCEASDGLRTVPDVLVLDFCMPGLSGLGIQIAVRNAHLPVPTVLVTGFADPSVDIVARRLGVRRVLHKPVDIGELLAEVRRAVGGPLRRQ